MALRSGQSLLVRKESIRKGRKEGEHAKERKEGNIWKARKEGGERKDNIKKTRKDDKQLGEEEQNNKLTREHLEQNICYLHTFQYIHLAISF